MRPDQERVRTLLTDTVTLLCKNGLFYNSELRVQGLLGITLDGSDVFIVHINETIADNSPSTTTTKLPLPMPDALSDTILSSRDRRTSLTKVSKETPLAKHEARYGRNDTSKRSRTSSRGVNAYVNTALVANPVGLMSIDDEVKTDNVRFITKPDLPLPCQLALPATEEQFLAFDGGPSELQIKEERSGRDVIVLNDDDSCAKMLMNKISPQSCESGILAVVDEAIHNGLQSAARPRFSPSSSVSRKAATIGRPGSSDFVADVPKIQDIKSEPGMECSLEDWNATSGEQSADNDHMQLTEQDEIPEGYWDYRQYSGDGVIQGQVFPQQMVGV